MTLTPKYKKGLAEATSSIESTNSFAETNNFWDYFSSEEVEDARELLSLCAKYRSADWTSLDFVEIQRDIIIMQSIQVILGLALSRVVGAAAFAEDRVRSDRSSVKMAVYTDEEGYKLTAEELRTLADFKAIESVNEATRASQAADVAKNLYFNVKDLIQLLSKACERFRYQGGE
jgi:hypothetical protein